MNSDAVPHEMLLKASSRHKPGASAGTTNEFATVRARREIGGIKKKKIKKRRLEPVNVALHWVDSKT